MTSERAARSGENLFSADELDDPESPFYDDSPWVPAEGPGLSEPHPSAAPREDGWEELLAELADEIERESALYVWPENKELAAKRVAALRLAAARGEPGT